MRWRKKIISARTVPKSSACTKRWRLLWSRKTSPSTTRCPDDDTGMNSVKPWTAPRISVSMNVKMSIIYSGVTLVV